MKCPKCSYLGFDSGDRCKNCGYDFSLVAEGHVTSDPDLPLRQPDPFGPGPHQWLEALDRSLELPTTLPNATADPLAAMPLDTVVAAPAAASVAPVEAPRPEAARVARRTGASALPLFSRATGVDDEPLIKLPAAPRPPLAVRRTPDKPRLRAVPSPVRHTDDAARTPAGDAEPVLEFAADPEPEAPLQRSSPTAAARLRQEPAEPCGAGPRLLAAAIDHLILSAIDLTVIYLTLKMAALSPEAWMLLPAVPLLAFLGLVKAAYFCAFTLVGGQTIGKMAAGIRVVGAGDGEVDPARAIRRTLAGAVSLLSLGLGFLPVFLAADRRALHDRVARTRVIAQP